MELWMWLLLGLGFLIFEFLTPGNLVTIWFAIGSVLAYLAGFFHFSELVQIIVFVIGSLLSLLLIRPLMRRRFQVTPVPTNADRYLGMVTPLTEATGKDHWGAVVIDGIRWSVREEHNRALTVGTSVRVVGLEGAKFLVREKEERVS